MADNGLHCDRCGDRAPFERLSPHEMGERRYWLCDDCTRAILAVWLIEHESMIESARFHRAGATRKHGVTP